MKIIRCLALPVKKTRTVIREVLLTLLLVIVVSETHRAAAPDLNIWSSNGPNAQVGSVVVDPSDPRILYAGGQGGVFKSIDMGASWSVSNQGLGNSFVGNLVIDPTNPNTLYAGTSNGAFKSTNGGANWVSSLSGLYVLLSVAAGSPSTVYAATHQGVFITTDSGQTWNARSCPDDPNAVNLLVADPQNPNIVYIAFDFYEDYFSHLYKSIDGGASWRRLEYRNTGGLITHSLKIDPVNPNIIYAATYLGVYKSSDGGVSWNLRGSPGAGALVMDPNNPGTIYAGGASVYKSTDDGTTWTAFNNGLTALYVNNFAFDKDGRYLHAATSTGVFSVRVQEGATSYEGDVAPRNAGDGVVNALDVVQIRRFAAGLDMPDPASNEFQRADCSPRATFGDGVIDAADVVQARRYAAGLDPLTPAAGPAIAADHHGDGEADAAVYRSGQWWLRQSSGLLQDYCSAKTIRILC